MRRLAPREVVEVARNRQLHVPRGSADRAGSISWLDHFEPGLLPPGSGHPWRPTWEADVGGRRARSDPGAPVNLERARLVGRTVGGPIGQEARRGAPPSPPRP